MKNKKMYFALKRILDIIVAVQCLVMFSPIMLLVAVLIKLDGTDGPVFADIPNRVGQWGKLFYMYKFRSMIPNAHELIKTDPRLKELQEQHEKDAGKIKIEDDPRITAIGRFIRKSDIDEMPQFINVLHGEMSIVGPRAYYKDEMERYKSKYKDISKLIDEALSVKPGITGPWQVSGRNELSVPERVELDAEYANTHSILNDLFIMLKTPFVVIFRIGAW